MAKLMRAEAQLRVLQDEIDRLWHPLEAWPVSAEIHRGGLEYRFYLGELPNVEPDWTLLVGEILFDLRSALDHLVWELHVRHYRGRTIPRDIERRSQFPIFDSYKDWRARGMYRIKKLSARDRRAIRFLQPYETRDDQWQWVRPSLWDLNELHNIDKHRQIHLIAAAKSAVELLSFPPEYGFRQDPVWGPAKSHGHVETWTFTKMPSKIQAHPGSFLEICIEQGDMPAKLVPLLLELTATVARVIRRFSNRFPPVPVYRLGSAYTREFWTS